MSDPRQPDPDRIRVVLDHAEEVVELDGGTLFLDGQESLSVVLRLAPWRARSVARVLQEWTSVSRIFHHPTRPHLEELDLSRTLELAASVLGDGDEPIVRSPRGTHVIPHRQRLAAVAVLGEREAHLSSVQRLALVDAAAWWLSEPNGGAVSLASRNPADPAQGTPTPRRAATHHRPRRDAGHRFPHQHRPRRTRPPARRPGTATPPPRPRRGPHPQWEGHRAAQPPVPYLEPTG